MSMFLTIAYLFFIGSVSGWVLELFFRRFISAANPERKWINPGFCVGPYIPLYGFGLSILYLFAALGDSHQIGSAIESKLILFACMAISMTAIEYLAGIICLKGFNLRLWDYSREWGNIQGLICPLFSLIWALFGAAYYFLVHPYILDALRWLSENLAFSFVIGFFFGVFTIDVCYSAHIAAKVRKFAADHNIVVRYEALKADIRSYHDRLSMKSNFILPFLSDISLSEHLMNAKYSVEGMLENLQDAGAEAKLRFTEAAADAKEKLQDAADEAREHFEEKKAEAEQHWDERKERMNRS